MGDKSIKGRGLLGRMGMGRSAPKEEMTGNEL